MTDIPRAIKTLNPNLTAAQITTHAAALTAAMVEFKITTPRQQAMFLAQLAHESGGFAHLEESLYYRTAARILKMWPTRFSNQADAQAHVMQPEMLANRVYANRNGNTQAGDGWKYRGRGYIQLTGRGNYADIGTRIGVDLVAHPEHLIEPVVAARSAAAFWVARGCNPLAAAGDVRGVTRIINGVKLAGLSERTQFYRRALAAIGS